jgi:GTP-binding protein
VARTSAAPGKTRLANIYRVARGGARPFYLVDLPGYGYARGGSDAAREFEALARAYFGRVDRAGRVNAALLLVDARHPGLQSDIDAWQWLTTSVERCALVATKIDKLSRAERLRAMKANEAAFEHPVWPVSATTGEGLEELWTLIERLLNSNPNPRLRPSRPPLPLPKS